jgi:membrane associated rhomboid family serine protease
MSYSNYKPNAFPPLVKNLIIINVIVFVAQLTFNSEDFNLTEHIMLYPIQSEQFYPYQIATHMFAHSPADFFHILFNMFGLWMFGRVLENVWGPKRFLFFYLACGVGAAICHLGVNYITWENMMDAVNAGNIEAATRYRSSLGPALGASGAVMGIFAAFAYLFPNTELYIMFIPVPVKAKWAVLGMAAIDLFGGMGRFEGDNVAHFAHLGGAVTGFIIVLIWNKTQRKRFY